MDKKVNELKVEHRNFLATLNSLTVEVQETRGRILECQDFLILDLESILGQMPGHLSIFGEKSEKLSFRRLDGYSLIYQKEGVYTLRFIGAAFGPGFRASVSVNGVKVRMLDIRTPRVYVLECDVPVDALNDQFADHKVERVKVQAESFAEGEEMPVFTYKNEILLLPKLPVAVKLVERYVVKQWSKEAYDSEIGKATAARVGPDVRGEEPSTRATPTVTIPNGYLMLKDTVRTWADPGKPWNRWISDAVFSNEDRTVSRTFKHWGGTWDEDVYIQVKYRKPIKVMKEREVSVGATGYAPFGTALIDLSADYLSFTLMAKWFNGREHILTPVQLTRPGVRALLETTSPPRLMVDLSWPESE